MFKDILSSMSIARQSVAYWVARAKAAQVFNCFVDLGF